MTRISPTPSRLTALPRCGAGVAALAMILTSSVSMARKLPRGIQCLLKAYPKHLCSARVNSVRWCTGTVMRYDDRRRKSFKERLDKPDLQDQMSMQYPRGPNYPKPLPLNFDPGRVRYEPFFKKMYGSSAARVRRKLTRVRWVRGATNTHVRVTRVNGVNKKLRAIVKALDRLPPRFSKFLSGKASGFLWRTIKGTRRLSPHSFGIALDMAIRRADYWRWFRPGPDGRFRYRNRIPWKIVEIFEKHGFIWGGKWYHFDTMHFEYRPELLAPLCAVRQRPRKAPRPR